MVVPEHSFVSEQSAAVVETLALKDPVNVSTAFENDRRDEEIGMLSFALTSKAIGLRL